MKESLYISTGSLQAGGTERVISILSDTFIEKGYNVKIFIWRSLPVFYKLNALIEVIDIPSSCKSNKILNNIIWFRRYLKKNPPALLIGFSAPFNMLSLLSSIGLGIKTVVCERNDPRFVPFKKYQRIIRNVLYGFADGILTQTAHNKQYFCKHLQKRTKVIFNPVFLDHKYLSSTVNVNIKSNKIISVARLKEQKNQKMLIRAFATFHKTHPEYELYIYGEGDYRSQLEDLISVLNMDKFIHLTGVVDNIFEILPNFDFFVLSSNFEGMPNTLIEAMCMGMPCISTKVSGATDLIEHNKNGLLIDVNSEDQLVEAMNSLSCKADLRYELGSNARKIYKNLNAERISQIWMEYLNEVILSKHHNLI